LKDLIIFTYLFTNIQIKKGATFFVQNLEITTIVGLVLSLQYSSFVSCTEVEGNPEQAQWPEILFYVQKLWDIFFHLKQVKYDLKYLFKGPFLIKKIG
jgi:hypothetical protein